MPRASIQRFSLLFTRRSVEPMIVSSLQTDGSFRYKDHISRTACLLKDESEVYKSVKTYFDHQNSYESEWCSVLDGILMSQANGCGDVQLENDNLSVINCLVNERKPPQSYAAKYYVDVMHASRDMDWLEIRWIPRKLNKADGLFRIQ
jgi:ribonuclease HI